MFFFVILELRKYYEGNDVVMIIIELFKFKIYMIVLMNGNKIF